MPGEGLPLGSDITLTLAEASGRGGDTRVFSVGADSSSLSDPSSAQQYESLQVIRENGWHKLSTVSGTRAMWYEALEAKRQPTSGPISPVVHTPGPSSAGSSANSAAMRCHALPCSVSSAASEGGGRRTHGCRFRGAIVTR